MGYVYCVNNVYTPPTSLSLLATCTAGWSILSCHLPLRHCL